MTTIKVVFTFSSGTDVAHTRYVYIFTYMPDIYQVYIHQNQALEPSSLRNARPLGNTHVGGLAGVPSRLWVDRKYVLW